MINCEVFFRSYFFYTLNFVCVSIASTNSNACAYCTGIVIVQYCPLVIMINTPNHDNQLIASYHLPLKYTHTTHQMHAYIHTYIYVHAITYEHTWAYFTVLSHIMRKEKVVSINTFKPLARNNLFHLECWNTL